MPSGKSKEELADVSNGTFIIHVDLQRTQKLTRKLCSVPHRRLPPRNLYELLNTDYYSCTGAPGMICALIHGQHGIFKRTMPETKIPQMAAREASYLPPG